MPNIVDIAEFRSSFFSPALPDESQVNPAVYGAELAYWLCINLAKHEVVTSYPENEDWGWFVEYFPGTGSEFAVHCGNIDGSKDYWMLSLHRHARKMFGRDVPPFIEADPLLSAIRDLLQQESSISEMKWLYHDTNVT